MPDRIGGQHATFGVRPLSPATWPDLERLFGLPGGSIVRGCWCMYYRKSGKSADPAVAVGPAGPAGAVNKQALCDLVDNGVVPGLIGYLGDVPVGWISLGPRGDYLKLRRSPIMKPVDDTPVWSVVCSGARSLYERAGFLAIVRRSPTRLVMRLDLGNLAESPLLASSSQPEASSRPVADPTTPGSASASNSPA